MKFIPEYRTRLKERVSMPLIKVVCSRCAGPDNDEAKAELYSLVFDGDDRTAYNALWIMTHFADEDKKWLMPRRDALIDLLLQTQHVGKRRLLLCLLESLPTDKDNVRTDYYDFCLARINSTEPYGIRALCLKQAFAICCVYPELLGELESQMNLMEYSNLSPGLRTARKNIFRQLRKLPSR